VVGAGAARRTSTRACRTIFVADAHRDDGRRIVQTDEQLTAFLELESAVKAAERVPE